MSRSGTKPFIIITLDEDMKHLYNFVVSFTMQKGREVYRYYKNVNKRGSYSNIALATWSFQSKYKYRKVEQLALKGKDYSSGYPEICVLVSRCRDFQIVGPLIFCNIHLEHLKRHLIGIYNSTDKGHILMLVYMSLNQMEINVNTTI